MSTGKSRLTSTCLLFALKTGVRRIRSDNGFNYPLSIVILFVLQYHDDLDVGYSSSLACALVLLVFLGVLQATVLPRTIILVLLFLTAFIWISVVLMLLLAVRLRWILWDISHSFVLRLAITVFTIVLIYTVAQVNVVS